MAGTRRAMLAAGQSVILKCRADDTGSSSRMPADIFLSYCSADREVVWDLAARLREAGAEAWIDQEGIGAATQWSGEIVRALDECKLFVLLISEASLGSDYCRREVSLAAEQAKPLLPVYLEPATLTPELRLHFAGVQHLELQRLGPQETIREILQALLRAGGETGASGTAGRRIRHNVPAAETALIGRDDEVSAWKELLLTPSTRLLTLTAFGGLGKTRAALELAWRCVQESAAEFPQGVWWVAAEEIGSAAELIQAVSAALGLAPGSDADPTARLCEYLQPRKLLLFLDNLEQIAGAGKVVGELLRAAPGVRIVATSRRALGIAAEQRREVAPLLAPPEGRRLTPEEALAFPAVALFVERAKAREEAFTLESEDVDEVSELCRRLDGIPLAIELAAARVGSRSPAEMLERLSDRFKLLQTKAPELPDRRRALRGTMEWSYDLLSQEAQQFFAQIAVFQGGFLLSHAETVCANDDAEDLIERLQQHSFLRSQPDLLPKRRRFNMLESLREFAIEKLREAPDGGAALLEKHAQVFANVAEKALSQLRSAREAMALRELQADLPNVEAAFEWSRESGSPLLTARLGGALGRYYERRGYGRRALDRLEVAAEALLRTDEPLQEQLASVHRAQAGAWLDCGDPSRAEDYASRALILADAMGSPNAQAEAWNLLAGAAMRAGREDAASERFHSALSLARKAGLESVEATVLNNLAVLDLERREEALPETIERLEQSRAIRDRVGDRAALAETLGNLGLAAQMRQDLEAATGYYRQALKLDTELANPMGIAIALFNLGEIALGTGASEEALRLSVAAERIFDDLGSPNAAVAAEQAEAAVGALPEGVRTLETVRGRVAPLDAVELSRWAVSDATA